MMNVSGYHGMPSFKVRPKALSRHGTQLVQEYGGERLQFCKESVTQLRNVRNKPR